VHCRLLFDEEGTSVSIAIEGSIRRLVCGKTECTRHVRRCSGGSRKIGIGIPSAGRDRMMSREGRDENARGIRKPRHHRSLSSITSSESRSSRQSFNGVRDGDARRGDNLCPRVCTFIFRFSNLLLELLLHSRVSFPLARENNELFPPIPNFMHAAMHSRCSRAAHSLSSRIVTINRAIE